MTRKELFSIWKAGSHVRHNSGGIEVFLKYDDMLEGLLCLGAERETV